MQRPVIPPAEELYNTIMRGIEPDLTTDQIPGLPAKYAGETPEMKDARLDRYVAAYAAYDKAIEAYLKELDAKVNAYRKAAFKSGEAKSKEKEAQELNAIEAAFS